MIHCCVQSQSDWTLTWATRSTSQVINSKSTSLHATLKYNALLCSLCKGNWPSEMVKYLVSSRWPFTGAQKVKLLLTLFGSVFIGEPWWVLHQYISVLWMDASGCCKVNGSNEQTGPDQCLAHSQIIRSLKRTTAKGKGLDWLVIQEVNSDYSHFMRVNGERTWAAAAYQAVSERSGEWSVETTNMDHDLSRSF